MKLKIFPGDSFNKYDYGIILLIGLLAFGAIGGAFQLVRIFGLLFSPIVCAKLLTGNITKREKLVFAFFAFWLCYSIISLLWTPDVSQGLKEVVYFYIHFILFFLLIFWAKKAVNPLNAITIGWIIILLLTLPIAFYEIVTYQHLPISRYGSEKLINLGGTVVRQRFASVTFPNSNTYVVLVVFCLPFLFAKVAMVKKMWRQILFWVLILACSTVLVINASRGGILCLFIIFLTYLFILKPINITSPKNLILGLIIAIVSVFVLSNFSDIIFRHFLFRIEGGDLLKDSKRLYLYGIALTLFIKSLFLGTGVGSEVAAMSSLSNGTTTVHNLFLEVLMQYGLLIFCLFFTFLANLFTKIRFIKYLPSKFILVAFLLAFAPLFIINSGYLMMSSFWLFLSSLFVIGSYNSIASRNRRYLYT